ncbi:phage head completion protein [Pseudogemmobacter bohemicus]|uniref:phage head completion protein n=1 Tax=Pseudogemmobacter bohemicus TaxID=2250708 RepID=UPI000DD32596|nr:head-tail adaptor protein [Pseudogemmobacter bohemicus]
MIWQTGNRRFSGWSGTRSITCDQPSAASVGGKAELRQAGVSEFLTTFGEGVSNNAVFLLRWVPGVAVADRIIHGGKVWNIVAIAEIGRRKGIELRAVAA